MSQPQRLTWISDVAIKTIVTESSKWHPEEAGGLLLGYVRETEWVVLSATTAGSGARHCRLSYVPDQDYDASLIADEFKASLGVVRYLGDWHSHPDGIARLSRKDKSTLKRIAKFPDAQIKTPLMLICGGGKADWTLAVWTVVLRRWRTEYVGLQLRQFARSGQD